MESVNNVEKQLEVRIEQGREQLVVLKDAAYEKYCQAWTAMEQVKESTYDTLASAWEQAWNSYSSIVDQLKQYGHTEIENASTAYQTARANLAERTKDLENWVAENADKLKEGDSEVQVEEALKLHAARKEAYDKYLETKDALRVLYTNSEKESHEGVKSAEEQVKKTGQNLQRHLDSAADKTSEEYTKTKARLEEAKVKAEKELEVAKAHVAELYGKVSNWSKDVGHTLSEQSESLTSRLQQLAATSKDKVGETTEAATKVISEKWNQFYDLLKADSDYALQKLTQFKDTVQEKIQDVLVASGVTESLNTPPPANKETVAQDPAAPVSPINVPLAN